MKILKKLVAWVRRAPRTRTKVTLAVAMTIAGRYGLQTEIWEACTEYNMTPREALEEWDLINPCSTDQEVCENAYHF